MLKKCLDCNFYISLLTVNNSKILNPYPLPPQLFQKIVICEKTLCLREQRKER